MMSNARLPWPAFRLAVPGDLPGRAAKPRPQPGRRVPEMLFRGDLHHFLVRELS